MQKSGAASDQQRRESENGQLMRDSWNISFDNMKTLLRVTVNISRYSSDMTIGFLCGDFTFYAVLHAVKIVAKFYKV